MKTPKKAFASKPKKPASMAMKAAAKSAKQVSKAPAGGALGGTF